MTLWSPNSAANRTALRHARASKSATEVDRGIGIATASTASPRQFQAITPIPVVFVALKTVASKFILITCASGGRQWGRIAVRASFGFSSWAARNSYNMLLAEEHIWDRGWIARPKRREFCLFHKLQAAITKNSFRKSSWTSRKWLSKSQKFKGGPMLVEPNILDSIQPPILCSSRPHSRHP